MNVFLKYIKNIKPAARIIALVWFTAVVAFVVNFVDVNKYIFFEDVIVFLWKLSLINVVFVLLFLIFNDKLQSANNDVKIHKSDKSWLLTLVLNLLSGYFGSHRFYVGKKITGVVYLLTFGLFGFGYVYDFASLILGKFTDKSGRVLKPDFDIGATSIPDVFASLVGFVKSFNLRKVINKSKKSNKSSSLKSTPRAKSQQNHKTTVVDKTRYKAVTCKPDINVKDNTKINPNTKSNANSRANATINTSVRPEINPRINGVDSYDSFVSDMEKYKNHVVNNAEFVPFGDSNPTYRKMNKKQKEWYFYWRHQVKNKEYPDTDISYVLFFMYELINGFHWSEPKDGYDAMVDVWLSYRGAYPELDKYLLSWLFDFSCVNNIEYVVPDLENLSFYDDYVISDYLISKQSKVKPLKLSFPLVDALCDYSLVGSKFYKDGHQLLMIEAIPRVVAFVDAYLLKKNGKGILSTYGPIRKSNIIRYPFKNIIPSIPDVKIRSVLKRYTTNPSLRGFINELVRFAENVLREQYNARGRLRGVNLDPQIAAVVRTFLEREYSPNKKQPEQNIPEENKPGQNKRKKVKINHDSLNNLRRESDAVRRVLKVTEQTGKKAASYFEIETIKDLYKSIPKYCLPFLNTLQAKAWEMEYDSQFQASIDKINELSCTLLACAILVTESGFVILEDDYRDAFDYIYNNLHEVNVDESEQNDTSDSSFFDLNKLSDSLKDLLSVLSPTQIEIIYIILNNENIPSRLEEIASREFSMPEILLDEINDIATQIIGDILIDTLTDEVCIFEQYANQLKDSIIQEENYHG